MRLRHSIFLIWIVAIALALLLLACTPQDDVTSLKLGHGLDVSHPVHRAMVHLDERVRELSGGTLRVDVYPSEQLGSERECLELLQIGSLAMTKVSAAVLESFAPDFRVLGLPYLFRDRDHFFTVLDGEIGRDLLHSAEAQRLRGLAFYDAGSRSFYTRQTPVDAPADLEGLKIRTQESATALEMVRRLGGAATPISWGELYTALQQGVVDGAENNPPSFHLSRHYEVARVYSLDEHTSVPDVLVVGTEAWNRLEPSERKWLQQAARDSALYQRDLWRQAEADALAAVQADGVEVIRPDKEPFRRAVAPMYEPYLEDPRLGPLVEAIRAAGTP